MRGLGYDTGIISHRARSIGPGLLAEATWLNSLTRTFTRASSALDPLTYRSVATGVARQRRLKVGNRLLPLDYCGLLRTNLCLRSQDFGNASWTKTDITVTSGATRAPDGTMSSDLITEGSAGTAALTSAAITITATRWVAASWRVKKATSSRVLMFTLASDALVNGACAWVNVRTGVAGTISAIGTGTAGAVNVFDNGDGFWIVTVSGKVAAAATALQWSVNSASADASTVRVAGAAYSLWGAQVEQMLASATVGSASEYIPTTSATVTRSADVLTVPYLFGTGPGTVIAVCIPYLWSGDQDGSFWTVWSADDTTASKMVRNTTVNAALARSDNGALRSANLPHGLVSHKLSHLGLTWAAGSACRGLVNGVFKAVSVVTTGPFDANTIVRIGCSPTLVAQLQGWAGIAAWKRTLSDAEVLAFYNYVGGMP